MTRLLDCTSRESATESLARLFGVEVPHLANTLSSVAVDWDGDESEETQILAALGFRSSQELPLPEATRWFHATRAPRHRTFADGLLPTGAALPELWKDLESVARQWTGPSEWAAYRESFAASDRFYAHQFHSKAIASGWQGPFAFLVRDAALGRHRGHKHFTRICEALEDICADYQEVFGHPLRSAYEASTEPCLVVFTAPGGDCGAVTAATVFLYRAIQAMSHGRSSNTCYSGKGKAVPPSWIERVEWISERSGT